MAVATVNNSIYIVDLILYGIYTLLPNRNIPLSVFIRDVSAFYHGGCIRIMTSSAPGRRQ
jgi:hypothetical protein